jgi:hypothetical protein
MSRSNSPRNPQLTSHEVQPKGVTGPKVGSPWPELRPEDVRWPDSTSVSIQYSTTRDNVSKLFAFRTVVKTRTLVVLLLAGIVGYAIVAHDRALIRDVLRIVSSDGKVATSESPPTNASP